MKILTLNKAQEKKLLALCKEFFPEYLEIQFYITEDEEFDQCRKLDFVHFLAPIDLKTKKPLGINHESNGLIIHFYELCLTELPKRIWDKLRWKLQRDYMYSGINSNTLGGHYSAISGRHPVDFLWAFVQDCKKNKYFKS